MRPRRLAVVMTAVGVAGCGTDTQGPVADPAYGAMQADNIATGVVHYVTQEGLRQAVLRADTAYFFEDSAYIEMRGVNLLLYDRAGTEAAELTAASGELDTRTEAMVARGDVVLISREGGRRIETEELHYEPRRRRLWSDVRTVVIDGEGRIEGVGFTAEDDLRTIEMREPRGRTRDVQVF